MVKDWKEKYLPNKVEESDMFDSLEPAKGVPYSDEKTVFVNKDDLGEHSIDLPEEILTELDWKPGDVLGISPTELCNDWGTVDGLTLRNISKEIRELADEVKK